MYIVLEKTTERLSGVLCHYGPFPTIQYGTYYSYSIKITESFNPEDGSLKERKAEILDLREEFKND